MGTVDGVTHGALDHAELLALGLRPEELIDFSSNLNPFGPPDGVRTALATLDPAPYPDRSCHGLRLALAARHNREPVAILPGNGANELIHVLARALLHAGASALVIGPTYGEYAHATQLAGAEVCELRGHEAGIFALDWPTIHVVAARLRPRLIWLCAPNNPTGVDVPEEQIVAIAGACSAWGGYLVLDRSYGALRRQNDDDRLDSIAAVGLLTIHSLTKTYALAGLRLGYLLAAPELVARIARYQPTWSVSSAAQAAGLAALRDADFLAATVPQLWAESDALCAGLRSLDLRVERGALPFVLVRTGDGRATRAALLAHGCVVRDCASFGLPAWVRVAPRRSVENGRLLAAWKEIVCRPPS